ncbi:basic secretory protein-like protein [Lederbergia citrea]|uniref:basic secretory protein-like protein n=1 Tax=Lederbergia citrea TaxID=2833581 RepID=UPI001BCA002B|nr:basic secretory protein-like protein [Lederbergia citrea]MBS4178264.1 hypothetical protein [Lederbergia citrea]
MRKKIAASFICASLAFSSFTAVQHAFAEDSAATSTIQQSDSQFFEKRGYELEVISDANNADLQAVIPDFVELYFKMFPKLVKDYAADRKTAPTKVTLKFDPTYDGVAYASNGTIVVSVDYIVSRPYDVALFTHELSHIVQAYPRYDNSNWWLVEGISDYIRYAYGPHDGRWMLPEEVKETDRYDSGYRVTARFLLWLEQHKNKTIVDQLNAQLQQKTYDLDSFKTLTGKSIDELWQEYKENPEVKVKYKIK